MHQPLLLTWLIMSHKPESEPSVSRAETVAPLEQAEFRHVASTTIEIEGGLFRVERRPEVISALDARALAQSRLTLLQTQQIEALEKGISWVQEREEFSKTLVGGLHKTLLGYEREVESHANSEYGMFKKFNLHVDLGSRSRIEQVVRDMADEPSEQLQAMRQHVLRLGKLIDSFVQDEDQAIIATFIDRDQTSQVKEYAKQSLRAFLGLDYLYGKMNLTFAIKQWKRRRQSRRGQRDTEQDFSNALHQAVRQIPGIGLDAAMPSLRPELRRKEYLLIRADVESKMRLSLTEGYITKRKSDSLTQALLRGRSQSLYLEAQRKAQLTLPPKDQRQAETLWARERIVNQLLRQYSRGDVQTINDFLKYLLHLEVEAQASESGTALVQSDPLETLDEAAKTLETAEVAVASFGSLNLAELDYLHRLPGGDLDGETLKRFAHDPERRQEVGWYDSWVLALERAIIQYLHSNHCTPELVEQLFAYAVRGERARDMRKLFRQLIPGLESHIEDQVLWFGRLSVAQKASQEDQSLEFAQCAAQYLESNEYAQRAFEVHILSVLGRRYDIAVQPQIVWLSQTETTNRSSGVSLLRTKKHNGGQNGECVSVSVENEAGLVVTGLSGIAYSDRLDPRAKLEDESAKFQRLMIEDKFAILPLEAETSYQTDNWTKTIEDHLAQHLSKLSWQETGDPLRIAKEMFTHIVGLRPRDFAGYAERAYCFHPPGGHKRFYIVLRVVPLDEGEFVVWKVALTQKEQSRTRHRGRFTR